jgi:hypothetical protein
MSNFFTRITVPLSQEEFYKLREVANLEYRQPREQARYILRRALFGESPPTDALLQAATFDIKFTDMLRDRLSLSSRTANALSYYSRQGKREWDAIVRGCANDDDWIRAVAKGHKDGELLSLRNFGKGMLRELKESCQKVIDLTVAAN